MARTSLRASQVRFHLAQLPRLHQKTSLGWHRQSIYFSIKNACPCNEACLLLLNMSKLTRFRAGTNIGGGTFWGLCKLLTGMDNFDDILSLSSQGDNSNVRNMVRRTLGQLQTDM